MKEKLGGLRPGDRSNPEKKPDEKKGLTRRAFLGALTAPAVGALVAKLDALTPEKDRSRLFDEPPILEARERYLDECIQAVQLRLRDPDVLEAKQGKGREPVSVLADVLASVPILADDLTGTSRDAEKVRREHVMRLGVKQSERYVTGNGVFLEDGRILTAAHVLHGSSLDGKRPYPTPGVDVALTHKNRVTIVDNFSHMPVHEDPSLSNRDIDGEFVAVIGEDPDQTSGPTGEKVFPGVAMKIPLEIARILGGSSEEVVRLYASSFLIVLPPGEAKPHDTDVVAQITAGRSEDAPPPRAAGMSGSAVYTKRREGWVLAGTFWGTCIIKDTLRKRSIEFGLFAGIDEIRRVREKGVEVSSLR